jgi:RHS repeat-associated protein
MLRKYVYFLTSLLMICGTLAFAANSPDIDVNIKKLDAAAEGKALGLYKQMQEYFDKDSSSQQVEISFKQIEEEYGRSTIMADAMFIYGEYLTQKRNDHQGAVKELKQLVERFPESSRAPEAQFRVADITRNHIKNGYYHIDYPKALDEAEQVVKKWPQSPWSIKADYFVANTKYFLSNRPEAKRRIEALLKKYQYDEDPSTYSEALYSDAFYDYMDNDFDTAKQKYRDLINNHPDSYLAPEAQRQLVRINYFEGNYVKAKDEINLLLEKYPDSYQAKQAPAYKKILENLLLEQQGVQKEQINISNICGSVAYMNYMKDQGINLDLSDSLIATGYDKEKGTTLAGISYAAQIKGLNTKGLKLYKDKVLLINIPFIAYTEVDGKGHFVYVRSIQGDLVNLTDQAGNKTIPTDEFLKNVSGIVFLVYKSDNMENINQLIRNLGEYLVLSDVDMEQIWGGEIPTEQELSCKNMHSCDPGPPSGCNDSYQDDECCKTAPSLDNNSGSGTGAPLSNSGSSSLSNSGSGALSIGVNGGTSYFRGKVPGKKTPGLTQTDMAVNYGTGWAYMVFPQTRIPSISGGKSVEVSRSYSSQRFLMAISTCTSFTGDVNFGPETPWGDKWFINFAMHIWWPDTTNNQYIYWIDPVGNQYEYTKTTTINGKSFYIPTPGLNYTLYNRMGISSNTCTIYWQDGVQYEFLFVSDQYARLNRIKYPGNRYVTCEYANESSAYITAIRDLHNRAINFGYSNGKLASITDIYNQTIQYTYDSNSDLTQIAYPNGYSVYYDYDCYHQITAIRDTLSGNTAITAYSYATSIFNPWTSMNRNTTKMNIENYKKETQYAGKDSGGWWAEGLMGCPDDPSFRMTFHFTNCVQGVTTIRYQQYYPDSYDKYYDANRTTYNSDMSEYTDEKGKKTYYEIDKTYGHVTTIINDNCAACGLTNSTTRYLYNNFCDYVFETTYNVLTCVIDGAGRKTSYSWDSQWNIVGIRDPEGNTISLNYDSYSNLTSICGPYGAKVYAFYDSYSQLTMAINPSQGTTYIYYDTFGHHTAVKNPLNQCAYYGYDTIAHLLTSVKDSQGGLAQYEYNLRGQLVKVKDAKNHENEFKYDLRNRLIEAKDGIGQTINYYFDAWDNLTTLQNPDGTKWSYQFDYLDRLTTRFEGIDTTVGYADVYGRMTSMINPIGNWFRYSYDTQGNLSNIVNWANQTTAFYYNNLGIKTSVVYPNHTRTDYSYSLLNQPVEISTYKDSQLLKRLSYSYDSLGRRTSQCELSGSSTFYYYDTVGRLTSEKRIGTEGIKVSLPSQGNYGESTTSLYKMALSIGGTIVGVSTTADQTVNWGMALIQVPYSYQRYYAYDSCGNRTSLIVGIVTTDYYFNSLDQLTTAINSHYTTAYCYDLNGNMTTKGDWYYQWDVLNRLTQVTHGSMTVKYDYNVFGERIRKTNEGDTTGYVMPWITPMMTRRNGAVDKIYTLSPGGLNRVVSVRDGNDDYFYHYDPIGNIMFMTDSSGNIVTEYVQEGFGNLLFSKGTSDNLLHLTGKEWDPEVQLYYFGARWYNPEIGRWLSREPYKIDGPNLYQYTFNDPINGYDEDGYYYRGKDLYDHYSAAEVAQFKNNVKAYSTAGVYQGYKNIVDNHRSGGDYDFKSTKPNSLFPLNGEMVQGNYFGNYLFGYAVANYMKKYWVYLPSACITAHELQYIFSFWFGLSNMSGGETLNPFGGILPITAGINDAWLGK